MKGLPFCLVFVALIYIGGVICSHPIDADVDNLVLQVSSDVLNNFEERNLNTHQKKNNKKQKVHGLSAVVPNTKALEKLIVKDPRIAKDNNNNNNNKSNKNRGGIKHQPKKTKAAPPLSTADLWKILQAKPKPKKNNGCRMALKAVQVIAKTLRTSNPCHSIRTTYKQFEYQYRKNPSRELQMQVSDVRATLYKCYTKHTDFMAVTRAILRKIASLKNDVVKNCKDSSSHCSNKPRLHHDQVGKKPVNKNPVGNLVNQALRPIKAIEKNLLKTNKKLQNAISKDKEKISANKEKISADKEKISADKKKISADKEKISAYKKKISADKKKISADKEKISADKEKISADKEKISADKKLIKAQKVELKEIKRECRQYRNSKGYTKRLEEFMKLMRKRYLKLHKKLEQLEKKRCNANDFKGPENPVPSDVSKSLPPPDPKTAVTIEISAVTDPLANGKIVPQPHAQVTCQTQINNNYETRGVKTDANGKGSLAITAGTKITCVARYTRTGLTEAIEIINNPKPKTRITRTFKLGTPQEKDKNNGGRNQPCLPGDHCHPGYACSLSAGIFRAKKICLPINRIRFDFLVTGDNKPIKGIEVSCVINKRKTDSQKGKTDVDGKLTLYSTGSVACDFISKDKKWIPQYSVKVDAQAGAVIKKIIRMTKVSGSSAKKGNKGQLCLQGNICHNGLYCTRAWYKVFTDKTCQSVDTRYLVLVARDRTTRTPLSDVKVKCVAKFTAGDKKASDIKEAITDLNGYVKIRIVKENKADCSLERVGYKKQPVTGVADKPVQVLLWSNTAPKHGGSGEKCRAGKKCNSGLYCKAPILFGSPECTLSDGNLGRSCKKGNKCLDGLKCEQSTFEIVGVSGTCVLDPKPYKKTNNKKPVGAGASSKPASKPAAARAKPKPKPKPKPAASSSRGRPGTKNQKCRAQKSCDPDLECKDTSSWVSSSKDYKCVPSKQIWVKINTQPTLAGATVFCTWSGGKSSPANTNSNGQAILRAKSHTQVRCDVVKAGYNRIYVPGIKGAGGQTIAKSVSLTPDNAPKTGTQSQQCSAGGKCSQGLGCEGWFSKTCELKSGYGTAKVAVTDSKVGGPIPGIKVSCKSSGSTVSVNTDKSGIARVTAKAGSFSCSAEGPGYKTSSFSVSTSSKKVASKSVKIDPKF